MQIQLSGAELYNKLLQKGAKTLRNGDIKRTIKLSDGRKIKQVISANGNKSTKIIQNGEVIKSSEKWRRFDFGYNLAIWDDKTKSGKFIRNIKINDDHFVQRVEAMDDEAKSCHKGTVTLYRKKQKTKPEDALTITNIAMHTLFDKSRIVVPDKFFSTEFLEGFLKSLNLSKK